MIKYIQGLFNLSSKKDIKVFINYRTKKEPWGGGNQFLKALGVEFNHLGILSNNPRKATHIIFNSHHDLDWVEAYKKKFPDKYFIHRVDGPISLIRGGEHEVDDEIFKANLALAHTSIFQSKWSLYNTRKLGYNPISPHVVINGSDYRIFNTQNRISYSNRRKLKIISSSWSNNPRKGGDIYKWLDEALDFSQLDYTFVGRTNKHFKNIRLIAPQPSEMLANLLKHHDIYITASDQDPCSNALIEALSCGLPAIFFNRGGHPEIVQQGGLGFENKSQIPNLIKQINEQYYQFQKAIDIKSIKEVTQQYLKVLLTISELHDR